MSGIFKEFKQLNASNVTQVALSHEAHARPDVRGLILLLDSITTCDTDNTHERGARAAKKKIPTQSIKPLLLEKD